MITIALIIFMVSLLVIIRHQAQTLRLESEEKIKQATEIFVKRADNHRERAVTYQGNFINSILKRIESLPNYTQILDEAHQEASKQFSTQYPNEKIPN